MVEEQTSAGDETGPHDFSHDGKTCGGHHNRGIMWDTAGSRWVVGNDWMEEKEEGGGTQ